VATDAEFLGGIAAPIPLNGQRILFFDSFGNILDAYVVSRITLMHTLAGPFTARGRDLHFNVMGGIC